MKEDGRVLVVEYVVEVEGRQCPLVILGRQGCESFSLETSLFAGKRVVWTKNGAIVK